MTDLISSPLWFILGLLALIATFHSVKAVLGYLAVAKDAESDYQYKTERAMVPMKLPKESYLAIYKRVNNPRGSAYVAGGLWAILLTTPILFFVLGWILNAIYNLSGQNRVIEPGYLVWQFMLFFLVVMIWAGIAYAVARHYHRHTPGSLQFEIDEALYGEDT